MRLVRGEFVFSSLSIFITFSSYNNFSLHFDDIWNCLNIDELLQDSCSRPKRFKNFDKGQAAFFISDIGLMISTNQQWIVSEEMVHVQRGAQIQPSNSVICLKNCLGWVPFTEIFGRFHNAARCERLHDGSCFASAVFRGLAKNDIDMCFGVLRNVPTYAACLCPRLVSGRSLSWSGNERASAMSEEIDQHTVLSMCWMPVCTRNERADGPVTLLLIILLDFCIKGFKDDAENLCRRVFIPPNGF